jgi:hypothetical protein
LGGIQKEVLKWYQELNDFKKWDTDNNGFLDVAEKAALDARKKEILLILKRLLDVSKLKGLNMPFSGIVEKMLEKTMTDSVLETTIPKPKFGSDMKTWVEGILNGLSEFKDDPTPINLNLLKSELKSAFAKDPVNIYLAENISNSFDGKTRGEIAISVITGITQMYDDNYWESKFAAEKTWRAAYKKDKSMIDQLPKVENIIAKFKSERFEDKTDPNHPDVKATEEAKLEAAYKEFDKKLFTWKSDCDLNIKFESDSFPQKKISKILVEEQANKALSGISITPFSLFIREEILKRLPADDSKGLNTNNLLSMMELLKTVIGEAVLKFERKSENALFEAWLKNPNVFPNPGKLRDWAIMSVPVSQLDFEEDMKWWINNTKSAVAELYKEKSHIKFDKKRLLRAVSPCFSYLSTVPGELSDEYILPILASAKQTTLSVKELDELWVKALDNLSKSLSIIYKNLLQRGIPMADLPTKFPTAASIGIALDQSEYAVPTPLTPVAEEGKMLLRIELNVSNLPNNDFWTVVGRTTGLFLSALALESEAAAAAKKLYEAYIKTKGIIFFEIPLHYENFKINSNNGAKEVWYPVPKTDSLTMSFQDSTLTVSNPRIRAINTGIMGETSLTKKYQISFEFSLPQEVISAAVSASSSGGIVVVDYERSSSGETSYNIEAKKNTINIDFELGCNYYEGMLNVTAIDGTVDVKIPIGSTAEWFKFKAKSLNKIQLKPFPNK